MRTPCLTELRRECLCKLDALRPATLATLRRDELTALHVEFGRLDDPLVKAGGTQGIAFRSLLPDFAELNDVVVRTAQDKLVASSNVADYGAGAAAALTPAVVRA